MLRFCMRKPLVAKPRSAVRSFSLSRTLPRLNLPRSAASVAHPQAHPVVGKPGRSVFGQRPLSGHHQSPAGRVRSVAPSSVPPTTSSSALPSTSSSTSRRDPHEDGTSMASESADAKPADSSAPGDTRCARCDHGESSHPTRYHCDKYPHSDPLLICGCESDLLEEVCRHCGHKAHRHKPRHRCRAAGCVCWGFETSQSGLPDELLSPE